MKGKCTKEILTEVKLVDGIAVRQFEELDFPSIQVLYEKEGWMTFANNAEIAFEAWRNSNISLVVVDGVEIVGLVRALTDGMITTYIAEIIVDKNYRGKGIGKLLLDICHEMYPTTRIDLLSTEHADEFYKRENFREITGFRKSYKNKIQQTY